MNTLPIVAAVPNYNMGEQLHDLLPLLLTQGYDDVYVLDDASTDGSRDIVNSLNTDIHFVAGAENVGSGGNRNRIIPVLGHEAIIHFIDADMQPTTDRMAERVADTVPSVAFGFIGGLINATNGRQMVYNFGPRQSLRNDLTGLAHLALYIAGEKHPETEASLRDRYPRLLKGWPNTSKQPQRQDVFWSAEANLVINSKVFESIGGYDEKLRDHEVQDLAIRMSKAGLARIFDPSFSGTHTAVEVRSGNRNLAMMKAEVAIARKHGLREWLTAR